MQSAAAGSSVPPPPAATRAAPPLYGTLRLLVRSLLAVFFRRVRVTGDEHLPATGPVILVGNHPNSLLDPALLLATVERPVAFAAKDALFRSALLRPILRGVGAEPIRRRVDADGAEAAAAASEAAATAAQPVDNQDAFAAMAAHLSGGGAIGIFPEGCSHDEAQLLPLKTGAARIALGALQAEAPVQIVPVGLNYLRARRFRSSVLVRFGPPLRLDAALLASATADPRAAARTLTAQIDLSIRALTIQSDDWATLRVLETVRRLYQPPGLSLEARVELQRRFAAGYARVAEQPEVKRLFAAVARFRERLDALDLNERDLQRRFDGATIVARFWRRTGPALLWLPLALPGLLLHGPAAIATGLLAGRLTPRRDVIATSSLFIGVALLLLTWAAVAGLLVHRLGPTALLWLPLLPASGWAGLRLMERYADARELLASVWSLLRFRKEIEALHRECRRLEAAVVAAVVKNLPPDLEPLFLQARLEQLGDLPTGDGDWDGRDSEVAVAAMDAAGVDSAHENEFLGAFAELLAKEIE